MSKKEKSQPKSKMCFIICPIGEKGTPTRLRSDQLVKYIIKPAVKECGYEENAIMRADGMSSPGIITSQIIDYVTKADLVVADLTDKNPNVFYELAIRHVVKKPIVQLIQKDQIIPFDVGHMRTIFFDLTNPDSIEECKKELAQQIHNVENNPGDADNPISDAINLRALQESTNPEEKSTALIISLLQGLDARFQRFENNVFGQTVFWGLPSSAMEYSHSVSLPVSGGTGVKIAGIFDPQTGFVRLNPETEKSAGRLRVELDRLEKEKKKQEE